MIQRGDGTFHPGVHSHNHTSDDSAAVSDTITAKVKAKAVEDIFKPASAIVEDVLLEELTDAACPALPKPEYIARAANRLCQKLRPKDPTTLDFEIEDDHIPDGFLVSDVKVPECRHLMFATNQQLQYLAQAKTWYVDGMFKLCRHLSTKDDGAAIPSRSGDRARVPAPETSSTVPSHRRVCRLRFQYVNKWNYVGPIRLVGVQAGRTNQQ